jgi:hypothetical protein
MRSIGILLVFTACHVGSAAQPDAPDEPGDGMPHGLGMFVDWSASPTLPGPVTDKITVSSASFQIDHFQIVADAGAVTRARYQLSWDKDGTPKQDEFPDAPPGVYSKITLVMMGVSSGKDAFSIRGTWRDNNVSKEFEIEDDVPFSTSFDCDEVLAAAGAATLGIKVDLKDALGGIDFKNAHEDDGILEIDGAEMAGFRTRLLRSFRLDN